MEATLGDAVVDVNAEEDVRVHCTTTAGPITFVLHSSWSPQGYARAALLFQRGYYDQSHFFRVIPHFLVQFGISYTTDLELKRIAETTIQDDPKREDLLPFREGMISFAGSGPNSRTSQLFVAYDGAGNLGQSPWETPFGEVIEGMDNVRKLYSYGDMPPWGKGPEQGPIRNRGSKYIEENFPLLDKFETCTVSKMNPSPEGGKTVMKEEFPDVNNIQAEDELTDDNVDGGNVDSKSMPEKDTYPIGKEKDRRAMRGSSNGKLPSTSLSFVKILALSLVVAIFVVKFRRRKRVHSE
jgi:cyclophilin family peptidyl-prolyl cis-trans isomerase